MNTNSIFHDWSSEIYNDRNNLVFEDKNKAYGAYQIRREYSSSVILSFFIACISILTLASGPIIVNYFIDRFGEREIPTLEGPTNLGPDIILDQNLLKEIIPPAEQKHELIQVATIQDVVPIVVNNIKPEESNYRDNASLSDKQSSTTTHEGIDNSIFIKDEFFDLDEELIDVDDDCDECSDDDDDDCDEALDDGDDCEEDLEEDRVDSNSSLFYVLPTISGKS